MTPLKSSSVILLYIKRQFKPKSLYKPETNSKNLVWSLLSTRTALIVASLISGFQNSRTMFYRALLFAVLIQAVVRGSSELCPHDLNADFYGYYDDNEKLCVSLHEIEYTDFSSSYTAAMHKCYMAVYGNVRGFLGNDSTYGLPKHMIKKLQSYTGMHLLNGMRIARKQLIYSDHKVFNVIGRFANGTDIYIPVRRTGSETFAVKDYFLGINEEQVSLRLYKRVNEYPYCMKTEISHLGLGNSYMQSCDIIKADLIICEVEPLIHCTPVTDEDNSLMRKCKCPAEYAGRFCEQRIDYASYFDFVTPVIYSAAVGSGLAILVVCGFCIFKQYQKWIQKRQVLKTKNRMKQAARMPTPVVVAPFYVRRRDKRASPLRKIMHDHADNLHLMMQCTFCILVH
ncbi:hypothetical protein T07_10553 [Trichinella nelsoni]|uniref:EGF-like domain-containing protein n=1 Tax=Trichinella nelsoni TaxID=6336 RepID=A0A0V0RFE1_9BILA|nr:hypothetical protein T07_10553 [Trichinella nelsoni]